MTDHVSAYSLEDEIHREAKRKLCLTGTLIDIPFHYDTFSIRSRQVFVPVNVMKKWHASYLSCGLDGLMPSDWTEIGDVEYLEARERHLRILPYADQEIVTAADIADLSDNLQMSYRTGQRWMQRYRIGGLFGLTSQFNPLTAQTKVSRQNSTPRDVGALSESDIEIIFKNRELLGPLAENRPASNAEVTERAKQVGVSERWLRSLRAAYLKYGLMGLAPKQRSDAGTYHGISDAVVDLVRATRLNHLDLPARRVLERVTKEALAIGETPPSEYQVRRIIKNIPLPALALADRRENEFRNKYRITYPRVHTGIAYQMDHCLVDVLVEDKSRRNASQSGEIRPWLSAIVDSSSRCLIAHTFSYDPPNRHTVAGLIRKAVLASPGGIPDKIYVDNGKDLVSNHVYEVCRELGIELHACAPHQPQHRGIIERFFGTLNTRLWVNLPGYVNSNVVKRNPSVRAELPLLKLIGEFQQFLDTYHQEPHSELQMSPLDFWRSKCSTSLPQDTRLLDILLFERFQRRVIKTGIKFANRLYWHVELGQLVGSDVLIRSDTRYETTDEIEVFHEGKWICTAIAIDSPRGKLVDREEIREAQRLQRTHARAMIAQMRTSASSTPPPVDQSQNEVDVPHKDTPDTRADEVGLPAQAPTVPDNIDASPRDIFDELINSGLGQ